MKSPYADPAALMRLKSLEMRARVVVEGFWKGLHRSPFHGFSVEFSEYRQYAPGDDPRFIDWRVYARSDRHFIKKFEDETNLRCHLLVDQSRSMRFGSGEVRKVDYATVLAATLAHFLSGQRDAVGVTTFHEEVVDHLPARHRPGHLRRLYTLLERECGGHATDLRGMLDQVPALVRKRGMIVVISDLLAPVSDLEAGCRALRVMGHDVVLMQVVDPAEEDFPFEDGRHFRDAETGKEIYVDASAEREAYRERFQNHRRGLEHLCRKLGMEWVCMNTERPLELALWEFVFGRRGQGMAGGARNRRARTSP